MSEVTHTPEVILIRASDVVPKPVDWLWKGWLVAGKVNLLGGVPGTGKTNIATTMSAIVSSGGQWPDGTKAKQGSVVFWSGEDNNEDTLNPRFRAAGADIVHVHTVGHVKQGDVCRSFDPAKDMDLLRLKLLPIKDIRLIVIDPIASAVSCNSDKNAEVRRALQPLVDLAEELQCAVVGITHFSKGTNGRAPIERITGSLAFGALARVVLVATKQEAKGTCPERCMLLRAKSNVGPEGGGFVYELNKQQLPDYPDVVTSRVAWGESVLGSTRDLLAENAYGDRSSKPKNLRIWLRDLLSAGPLSADELRVHCEKNGYPMRTVNHALKKEKEMGNIEFKRVGFPSHGIWALPGSDKPIEEF
jgi:putative DNA primase/helicase